MKDQNPKSLLERARGLDEILRKYPEVARAGKNVLKKLADLEAAMAVMDAEVKKAYPKSKVAGVMREPPLEAQWWNNEWRALKDDRVIKTFWLKTHVKEFL
jgi:hypothetical protein